MIFFLLHRRTTNNIKPDNLRPRFTAAHNQFSKSIFSQVNENQQMRR